MAKSSSTLLNLALVGGAAYLLLRNTAASPAVAQATGVGLAGLSAIAGGLGDGCGCGCKGQGGCGGGLGLFDNPLDLASWGIAEWVTVAGGGYLLYSLVGDVGAVRSKVRRYQSKSRTKKARREAIREELRRL